MKVGLRHRKTTREESEKGFEFPGICCKKEEILFKSETYLIPISSFYKILSEKKSLS